MSPWPFGPPYGGLSAAWGAPGYLVGKLVTEPVTT
jgi:hypothetical protein